jgi:hypothetical protein
LPGQDHVFLNGLPELVKQIRALWVQMLDKLKKHFLPSLIIRLRFAYLVKPF